MGEKRVDDRQELAIRVGAVRAVCVALAVLTEALEDREPTTDPAEWMERHKGLGHLISAVSRELGDSQAMLADDTHP